MSKVFNDVSELVGNTPLVRLNNLEKHFHLESSLVAKLEYLNPTGSAKDRIAKAMISDLEKKGELKKGGTIIEPTSGNTGIGLAAIGTSKGYKVILVMPETMSKERIKILKAYGAEVVLTAGDKGMAGSIEKAEQLQKEISGSIIAGQFVNPSNPLAHYLTTGPEIYRDSDKKVDILVASIGTGGTISGTGRFLKEQNKNIKVVGIEPASSPLLTKGYAASHKIQGIGANFIPEVLDSKLIDEVVAVSDEDSFEYARLIARTEGISVGISSGAALKGAIEVAKRKENKDKMIVVILPDSSDRYYSTELFGE